MQPLTTVKLSDSVPPPGPQLPPRPRSIEETGLSHRAEHLRRRVVFEVIGGMQQARDEAHRFAITFNRTRRKARTVTSQLLELPGIGPKRRRILLTAFGSLEGVRTAAPEAIAALPGFSVATATRLLDALRASAPVPVTPPPVPVIEEPVAATMPNDDPTVTTTPTPEP